MRSGFIWGLATFLFALTPAFAGELSFSDGQTHWKSTQCTVPKASPFLTNAETAANNLNFWVTQYNLYVEAAQNYMQCISDESGRDATTTSQAIINAGQDAINETQNTIKKLGAVQQE